MTINLSVEDAGKIYQKGYKDAVKDLASYRMSDIIEIYLQRGKQLQKRGIHLKHMEELMGCLERSLEILRDNNEIKK